ncbi:MAG: DNA double-strand break repair nuclease NurA [Candidatus Bathyarchaeia archaeon]
MAEEFFFNEFRQALENALEELGDEYSSEVTPFEDLYCSVWNPHESSRSIGGVVIASDGSWGTAEFSGGLRTWYVRALSHVQSEENLTPIFRTVVKVGHSLGGRAALMRSLEAENLLEAITRFGEKPLLALFDGSLYPYFSLYPDRLEKEVEYAETYARALSRLFTLVEKGIVLVGVVKDSEVNWLRMRLLLDKLRVEIPKLGDYIRRERNPQRIIQAIEEHTSRVEVEARASLGEYGRGFLSTICDEVLLDILVKDPGYTCPMALAPHNLYLEEEIKAGTMDWWGSRLRKRVSAQGYTDLIDAFDELYRHPPLAMFYWRPHHGLGVYRVDVPCSLLGYDVEWGSMVEDVIIWDRDVLEALGRICASLNSLSPSPYTVKPLLEVDEVVRMKEGTFSKAYQPIIQSELQRRGILVRPKKRHLRDYARRYMR